MILARLEQITMGRIFPGSKGSPLAVLNEMKNKLRSDLASDGEHNLGTLAGIPSGPEVFLISRFASTHLTCLFRIWTLGIVREARGVKKTGLSDSERMNF